MMCPMSSRLRACCPILMLALAFCAYAALPAQAQDATTQERLDRLERDLSMLQRQIYGGAQPGGAAATSRSTPRCGWIGSSRKCAT